MKRHAFASALLVLALAAPTCGTAAGQVVVQTPSTQRAPRPDVEAARRRMATAWDGVTRSGFSGAVRIDLGDETLLRAATGFADRSTQRSYTPDTQFQIGSLTKPFTAVAILKLQEEGRLSVHDPISRFLPGVPADKADITIHHLLTHSSGLPMYTPGESGLGDLERIEKAEFLRRTLGGPLAFRPGEKGQYSNPGYGVLAAIIESVTGRPYADYVRETQIEALGLTHTGYLEALDPLAVRDIDGGDMVACCWGEGGPWWNLVGNGGLMSTLDDFVTWRKALARGRLISRDSLGQMMRAWMPGGQGPGGEGYGWIVVPSATRGQVETAAGGNGRFVTSMRHYPEYDLTVLVTSNGPQTGDVGGMLVRAMFGEPEPAAQAPSPQQQAPEALARRLGEALLSDDAAARATFIQENAGPVFVQREGMPQIVSRFHAMHETLAGARLDKVEMTAVQRAELTFVLPSGERRTINMNVGGTPESPRVAAFFPKE